MGQRTQILLQSIDRNGTVSCRAYHFQWGYGRIMFQQFIELYTTVHRRVASGSPTSFHDVVALTDGYDITDSLSSSVFNPEDIDDVASVFACFDNNNGGMVIQVTEHTDAPVSFRIGLLLGPEETDGSDETPFSRFVTPEEYMDRAGYGYCDSEFRDKFASFMRISGTQLFTAPPYVQPKETSIRHAIGTVESLDYTPVDVKQLADICAAFGISYGVPSSVIAASESTRIQDALLRIYKEHGPARAVDFLSGISECSSTDLVTEDDPPIPFIRGEFARTVHTTLSALRQLLTDAEE